MKKIALVLLLNVVCLQTYAQITVYGKYKGKPVKLVYFKGDPDIIKSIEYERVGDLEKENNNLQSQITLKNKKINELQNTIGVPIAGKAKTDSLKYEIKQLQTDKDKLSADIKSNNLEISKLKVGIQPLKDSLILVKSDKLAMSIKISELELKNKNLTSQITEKDKKINKLQGSKVKGDANTEQIGNLNNQIIKLQDGIKPLKDSLFNANLDRNRISLKVSDLESKNKDLESQIVEKNKKIKDLQSTKVKSDAKEQIDALNIEIDKLKNDNDKLTTNVKNNNIEINKLKGIILSINDSLAQAKKEIKRLDDKLKRHGEDNNIQSSSIAVSYSTGIPFLYSNLIKSDFWDKNNSLSNQFNLIYEKPFGAISLGIGLGITKYKLKASFSSYEETINGLVDADNDTYDAICSYKNVKEDVSLLYMDIPISLSYGQPRVNRIGAYCKFGVTASILLQSKFNGEGVYNISGYYPDWDVEIHDVDVLNFNSNASSYENADYKEDKFVLWANLSGGVYLPLSKIKEGKNARFILKLGAKCDYSIMPLSKQIQELFKGASYHIKQSNILSGKGTRILSPGLEISIIYMLAKPQ
jgi:predicted  nucleic acid-binding Zn-ribbon protein